MANRQQRRQSARSKTIQQEDGLLIPPGQWSDQQRDEIILGLAHIVRDHQNAIEGNREAINSIVDVMNGHGLRLEALEEGTRPLKKNDELLVKVMGAIAAMPRGFHFNARNIADTLGEDNGKVHQKLMVLVRAGKVTQHKVNGRNASFTIALKED